VRPFSGGAGFRTGGRPDQLQAKKDAFPMFAVIKAQGKQFKVSKGDTLTIDRLAGETGSKLALGEVLMLVDGATTKVGKPAVEAEIVEHSRGDKIKVFKKRRRKNYHRTRGHRQDLTTVKITAITA
jgi:large subunit ribosomal protein L21